MARKLSARTQLILEVANKAYEDGEADIHEDLDDRGDGLASFLRQELIEVTEGAINANEARWCAIIAIRTAIRELTDVEDALVGRKGRSMARQTRTRCE